MLSPADAALVARDPALPGLAVLLDDDAVRSLLGVPVVRRYLRYKPGTSCVLGATAELAGGPADVLVTAYDDDGAAKVAKTTEGAPAGAVLTGDLGRGLVAVTAAADRDLPALALLAEPRRRRRVLRRLLPELLDVRTAQLSTLSYKPMRRWVGLLRPESGPPVVLRAYRTGDAAAAVAALQALAGGRPRTPRLLAADEAIGLLVLEYLPGRPLDELLERDTVPAVVLADAGRALAGLHSRIPSGLPPQQPSDLVAAVAAAAAQVGVLLPHLQEPAARLADALSGRLGSAGERSVVHGDFSADQVVIGPAGEVALLDLDRAAAGDAAVDVASLYAALVTARTTGSRAARSPLEVVAQVLAGYATVRTAPAPQAVAAHAAGMLLRRVSDPFRLCAPRWPEQAQALFDAAVAVSARGLDVDRSRAVTASPAGDPLALPPTDLLRDVVGQPAVLQVLKDKPGRRRTSRATGPRGTAIVKVYASARAPVVADRVGALRHGPVEPVVPRVLLCDDERHVVVLSEVPGRPYREALLAGDLAASARVGRALAGWHAAHRGNVPTALRAHTVDREIATLLERVVGAPAAVADAVRRAVPALDEPWEAATVVHRDLYEEQIVLDERVGLLDLDDAAAGPAELDLGNLLAHLRLLSRRTGSRLDAAVDALLTAYAGVSRVDADLLRRCETLSRLRLACLHRDAGLLPAHDERALTIGSPEPHAATRG